MAMTSEEAEDRIHKIEVQLSSIYNVIVGHDLDRRPGFAERMKSVETRMDNSERRVKNLTYIFIGLGLGVLVGGAIFGFISWRTIMDAIKLVK